MIPYLQVHLSGRVAFGSWPKSTSFSSKARSDILSALLSGLQWLCLESFVGSCCSDSLSPLSQELSRRLYSTCHSCTECSEESNPGAQLSASLWDEGRPSPPCMVPMYLGVWFVCLGLILFSGTGADEDRILTTSLVLVLIKIKNKTTPQEGGRAAPVRSS